MLVMVTGMVVAPAHADFWSNNPRLAKALGRKPAAQAQAPVVVETTPVAAVPAAAPVAKATPVTWGSMASGALGSIKSGVGSVVSGIGSGLSTVNAYTFKSLYNLTTPQDNVVANFVQSKTGFNNKYVTAGSKLAILAAVVGVAGYFTYKYFGKKKKTGGKEEAVSASSSTAASAATPTVAPAVAAAVAAKHGTIGSRTTVQGKFDAVKADLSTLLGSLQKTGSFAVSAIVNEFNAVQTALKALIEEMKKETALNTHREAIEKAFDALARKAGRMTDPKITNKDSIKLAMVKPAQELEVALTSMGLSLK